MSRVLSSVTELPLSCKSAAERIAKELEKEDCFANLTDDCCKKITDLERTISKESGETVALVAYRV